MKDFFESPAFQNVLAMVITGIVIPFFFVLFKEGMKLLRAKTANTQLAALPDILEKAAQTAVATIEQTHPSAGAAIKREMAIEAMKEILPNKTIATVQAEVASPHKDPATSLNEILSNHIEAAVHNKNTAPVVAPVVVAVPSETLPGGRRASDPPAH